MLKRLFIVNYLFGEQLIVEILSAMKQRRRMRKALTLLHLIVNYYILLIVKNSKWPEKEESRLTHARVSLYWSGLKTS